MQSRLITKYEFRIRTRSGATVENLSIYGQDEGDARRKLNQIYIGCEVLDSRAVQANVAGRHGLVSYEEVMDLITSPPS